MRNCLEIVVNWIAKQLLGNQEWNATFTDGINILKDKGIISSDIIYNHIRTRTVGIYGVLSEMGVHPDGTSTSNFAKTNNEAMYCKDLASNIIIYLLENYKSSIKENNLQ